MRIIWLKSYYVDADFHWLETLTLSAQVAGGAGKGVER
jgi:hypothetical protein